MKSELILKAESLEYFANIIVIDVFGICSSSLLSYCSYACSHQCILEAHGLFNVKGEVDAGESRCLRLLGQNEGIGLSEEDEKGQAMFQMFVFSTIFIEI